MSCSPEKPNFRSPSPSLNDLWLKNKKALNHVLFTMHLQSPSPQRVVLPCDEIDKGLRILASGCPNLRRLMVVNASELGLLGVAEECPTLRVLELHRCNDQVLRVISTCQNLQILGLIGNVDGLYKSLVTDIGLTILAQGCKRLVKLELSGCEGSYEGVKAIALCCQMLEELILRDHRMEGGWLSAVSYCENLKTLRFMSCKSIDHCGWDEEVGSCRTLERLHFEKCQLRNKDSLRTLLLLCQEVREVIFQNCWGLDNEMFSLYGGLRPRICTPFVEGNPEPQGDFMKDSEISPALSTLFSTLKDFQWRPDTKSLLSAGLVGTGMRKRGNRYFKKTCDWKSLPGA
ncbi:hypothetical protein RND71_018717 [Anisodus tanguticus]|uniref:F-box protein n=1 Tax=Anisodus tanguticus TaxID=243964 RepID=A0AAE1VH56_9SOLA|nr:hypothetical protein RND71_018717 [Anisodus tanguticus]